MNFSSLNIDLMGKCRGEDVRQNSKEKEKKTEKDKNTQHIKYML